VSVPDHLFEWATDEDGSGLWWKPEGRFSHDHQKCVHCDRPPDSHPMPPRPPSQMIRTRWVGEDQWGVVVSMVGEDDGGEPAWVPELVCTGVQSREVAHWVAEGLTMRFAKADAEDPPLRGWA